QDASGFTTRVAVIDTATGTQTGSTTTLAGYGGPLVSADGTHALITTSDSATGTNVTRVAVIDTATGTQTGSTVTLPGSVSGEVQLSADASRALITTTEGDATTGFTTQVAVINTLTGVQTGTTLTLDGSTSGTPVLSADGSRALI